MTILYCGQNDVINRLSQAAVDARIDDTPPTTWGDVLDDASRMIDEYCLLLYSDTNLAKSSWVKHRAADIATYLLCERRGNPPPPGIAEKYDRAITKLERIQAGRMLIADVAQRRDNVPALSNVRVRLEPFPNTVVERNRSAGPAEGYDQHRDNLEWFDYSI